MLKDRFPFTGETLASVEVLDPTAHAGDYAVFNAL